MLKETAVPSLFCMPTQILDIIFNEQYFVLFPFAFQSGFPTGLGHITSGSHSACGPSELPAELLSLPFFCIEGIFCVL